MSSPKKHKDVQCLRGRMASLSRFISKSTDKCIPFFNLLKGGKKFEWTEECETAFQALKAHLSQPLILAKSEDDESMILYLATTEHPISFVFLREERTQMSLVYYVSKRLLGAETRYPIMERLALCLVHASRKLRPYFQAHPIRVFTNHPLH